jgi:hypothetical protein
MVWVDMAGRLTGGPPLQLSQVRGQAALAAPRRRARCRVSAWSRSCSSPTPATARMDPEILPGPILHAAQQTAWITSDLIRRS